MAVFDLFADPHASCGNALLNWTGKGTHEVLSYAWHYRRAAMNLVAYHERQQHHLIDDAALPILFMYRHAFELYLKTIVCRAALLAINEGELERALPRLWREHSLVVLAQMAAPALRAPARPLCQFGLYDSVLRLAAQVDEVDRGSYSFRYPINASGEPSLPRNVRVNILEFSAAFETVLDDLQQFCDSLKTEKLDTTGQLNLALHAANSGKLPSR